MVRDGPCGCLDAEHREEDGPSQSDGLLLAPDPPVWFAAEDDTPG